MVLTERAKLVKVGLVVQLAEDTASQGVVQSKNKKKAQVDFGSDDLRWVPLTSLEVVGVAPNSANCADPAAAETASEPEPEPEPRPRSQRKPRQQPSSSLDPVPPAQVRSARSATRRQISVKEDSPRGATRSRAYTETSARQAAQEALSGLNFAVRPLRVSGAQSRLQSSEVRRRALADAEDQKAAETEAAERAFWAELREEGGRQREHLYTQRPVSAGLLRVSRSRTARPQSSRSPRIRVGSEVQREDKNSEPFERFLSRRFASPVKTVSSGAAASELVSNAEAMLQRLVAQYEEAFCSERPLSPQVSTLCNICTHVQLTATGNSKQMLVRQRCSADTWCRRPSRESASDGCLRSWVRGWIL